MAADNQQPDVQTEKRAIARRHLVFYLRVFEDSTGKILGHLADISTNGIMLVSEKKIPVDRDYRLRIRLPKEVSGREELTFSATSSSGTSGMRGGGDAMRTLSMMRPFSNGKLAIE